MLTAKYIDTGDILDITKIKNPRAEIEKTRLVCRFCEKPLMIKQGVIRIKHFAHIATCTTTMQRHPESIEHNLGKELLAEHVKKYWREYSNVRVEFEYILPEIGRIADIAMIFPSGWIVVHEVQLAAITNEELNKRTEDYASIGVDCVWWLGKSADTRNNQEWCIYKFGYSLSIDYEVLRSKVKSLQKEEDI